MLTPTARDLSRHELMTEVNLLKFEMLRTLDWLISWLLSLPVGHK